MNSKDFIKKYKKRLVAGPNFYNPDTSLMKYSDFEAAKCKILVIFPSPTSVKTVSSTAAALNDFVIEHCKDTFIDFAYMPEKEDVSLYDSNNVSYAIGNITHLDASHFDIVGFSISVLSDIISLITIIKSFERCDKPIPLFWSDRKNLPLGSCPILYGGGITAACADVVFGEVNGKQSFLDFLYLGSCDKTDFITNRYIESIEKGYCTRSQSDHDIPGYSHHDIPDFITQYPVSTIQDFVESLFDFKHIYQPQAYKVIYNKHRQIISNLKINPKAQDFVMPYYPHELLPDLGIARTIINANGDGAGTAQSQVSDGLYLKGTLIRTNNGLVKIEDLVGTIDKVESEVAPGLFVDSTAGSYEVYHKFSHGKSRARKFTTESGYSISLSDEHPVESYLFPLGWSWKPAGELKVGDYLTFKKGSSVWGDNGLTESQAEFLGRMVGDGWYNQDSSNFKAILYCSLFEHDYCVDLLERAKLNYTEHKRESVYAFNIHSIDKLGDRVCEKYGFLPYSKGGKKYGIKSIPLRAYDLTESSTKAFLKGFHDADGCSSGQFTTKGGGKILSKVTFDTAHKHIAEFIQQLLLMCGVPSRLHYYHKHRVEDLSRNFYEQDNDHWAVGVSSEYFDILNSWNFNKVSLKVNTKSKEHIPFDYDSARALGSKIESTVDRSRYYTILKGKDNRRLTRDFCLKHDFLIPDSSIFFDRIVSIEDVEDYGYDLSVLQVEKLIANGISVHNCSASGACSFCSEGNYTGGWVEKSKEQILWEVRECKKYSAGYKYKPYSFNANYITDYKGMLREFIKIYPKVTFINMRMEELGRDVDAIRMMKLIGSNRISAPIEGLSPRIQNNLLNKCLSEESLYNFMEDMVHAKMADIKVGGIFTGYEEEQDFQWICDFVDSFKKQANKEGGNFPFRLKVTPLVHYPLTPIEYLERKAAKQSYNGEHWLTDEWYEKFREHEVFFKVNGFRYSTFLEQSIVDLGRALTPLIYKHFIQPNVPVYSLRSLATDDFLEDLRNFIDPEYHFADRDPESYISPCHRIHIELMGSYVPRARRLLRAKRNGNIFDNKPDIRCLKTYDGAKTMCQHNCIKNDPMKIYTDVELKDGKLEGTFDYLYGCERCETPELRKARLLRPTPQSANSDDIIATPRIPQVQKLRFVLRRNKEFDLLNPNNTSHTFITKFLQKSDNLLDSYHSIEGHNLFWQSEPIFKYFCSGLQIVDTIWSKDVYKEVKSLIDEVNKELYSVQIESVQEILRDEKIKIDDINFFYFESDLPQEYFNSAKINYKGEIKADTGTGTMSQIGTIEDKNLKAPIFASKGKVCGVFAIPAKYNPINYMSGFISTVKKMGIDAIAESFVFESVMCMRAASTVCKNCGKEKALSSITTGKQMPFGSQCLCKAILTQKLKG